jgi:predicted PurR-regulated permease PerM
MPEHPESPRQDAPRRPGWRTRDVARATIVALAVYAVARLIVSAHTLIFVAFLGVLLGLAVAAGAERLQRFGIPRGLAAGLIVVTAVGLLVGLGAWSGPTVQRQYHELRDRLPEAFVRLDHWLAERQEGLLGPLFSADSSATVPQTATVTPHTNDTITVVATQDSLTHVKQVRDRLLTQVTGIRHLLFPVIHSTIAAVSGIVGVLFLAIYIGADTELYRRGILSLIPHRIRQRGEQVLDALADALRRWLITQFIAMLAIGGVTAIVLLVLHVPGALPLAILAGLLEFVPTVGPILSAIPAVAMAFVESPEKAAVVAVAYIGIQFLENHLLIPILMKEGVDLPPVLTILTQATMALAFGIMGLFVAVPVLVVATILVKMLYVEDVIGDQVMLPFTEERPPHSQSLLPPGG